MRDPQWERHAYRENDQGRNDRTERFLNGQRWRAGSVRERRPSWCFWFGHRTTTVSHVPDNVRPLSGRGGARATPDLQTTILPPMLRLLLRPPRGLCAPRGFARLHLVCEVVEVARSVSACGLVVDRKSSRPDAKTHAVPPRPAGIRMGTARQVHRPPHGQYSDQCVAIE